MTTSKAGSHSGPAFNASRPLGDDAQVWIVRHGETEWSLSGQHTGRTDLPLTAAGEKQAVALQAVLAGMQPVRVLSSPRARALETARLAGLQVDESLEDLAEWDYGAYEGVTTEDVRKDVPDWTVWTHGCPEGESPAEVQARADRVLHRVCEQLDEGPIVLVGHGHFSRALGARWIGLPVSAGANLLLGTAASSVLGAQYGTPALRNWNIPNPAA
ncbi:MAG: histidine phosphatase family protein [Jatrophihabitans sp.]